MDTFAGYKEAVRKVVPHAGEVLDPFHVVRLAGDKPAQCRRRLQQESTGRRGTRNDPPYRARRVLLKAAGTLTGRQRSRLDRLFGNEGNEPLWVMWGAYQRIIACYAEPDRRRVFVVRYRWLLSSLVLDGDGVCFGRCRRRLASACRKGAPVPLVS